MLCDMQNVLNRSARRLGELQRTNVQWVVPAVCLALILMAVACGDAEERTVAEVQPAVEERPVVEVQPEPEETPVAEAEPTVTEEPAVGEQPSEEVLACLATGTEKNLVNRAFRVWRDYIHLFNRPPYWRGGVVVYLTAEYHEDSLVRDEEREKAWERIRGPMDSGMDFNYVRDRYGGADLLTMTDEDGETQVVTGILVPFSEWAGVDQNRLPPEHRIPDCLEGVPVQFLKAVTIVTY